MRVRFPTMRFFALFLSGAYALRETKTLASLFAKSNSVRKAAFLNNKNGLADCAEFSYHDIENTPSSLSPSQQCYDLCAASHTQEVRYNCEYYSGFVDICSTTEYEYALAAYKKVDIPENLKEKCAAGESVERCKVCERTLNLEEQEFVHDTDGNFWWYYWSTGAFFIIVSGVVGMWMQDPVTGVVIGTILLGLWGFYGLYLVIPYEFSKWYIFNPSRWLIFRPHEW